MLKKTYNKFPKVLQNWLGHKKIEEIENQFKESINLSSEVLNFIATECKTNIRELIGVLNRVIAFSRVHNKTPLSISDCKSILKDVFNQIKIINNMNEGKFVDDEIVNKLLEYIIFNPQKKNKLIFDGYPRTINQAKNLDKLLSKSDQKINHIFFLSSFTAGSTLSLILVLDITNLKLFTVSNKTGKNNRVNNVAIIIP